MRMHLLYPLLLLFVPLPGQAQQYRWQRLASPTEAGLRGLYVVNEQTVWASGAQGAILRSTDGGQHWETISPPDSLDFRSIWAFSDQEALIASAGQPARIYRTENGGQHWQLVYDDESGNAFFDALSFWDSQRGLALSDPLEGTPLLLLSEDGGRNWRALNPPAAEEGEAFFAASNGSIAMAPPAQAWIGSGGGAIRVFYSPDGGSSWQIQQPPLLRLSEASGIYALTFGSTKEGVAIGGAYDRAEDGRYAAIYTTNGGRRWRVPKSPPGGYRSGLAHIPGTRSYICVGTTGSDISRDGGKSWQPLNDENLNSIRFAPSGERGWAIGPKGVLFLLEKQP
jgi:photosystem II stability/assembly factor-like uncharacterized protein